VKTVAASRHWLCPSQIGIGNIGGEWRLRCAECAAAPIMSLLSGPFTSTKIQ
jgi:hypothetical protein